MKSKNSNRQSTYQSYMKVNYLQENKLTIKMITGRKK